MTKGKPKRTVRGSGQLTQEDLDDDPGMREQLERVLGRKIGRQRQSQFSKQDVRRNAIRVLNVISHLSDQQRTRVLKHALEVNEV